jgi:hypothetical protein
MNFKSRRFATTTLLAVSLFALAAAGSTSAHEIQFGSPHYYGDCTIGSDGGNANTAHGFTIVRSVRIVGARGLVTARAQ